MKKHIWIPLSVVLIAVLVCVPLAYAKSGDSKPAAPSSGGPGIALAQSISTVTGVAISPLLGVGALGAWQYFSANTPDEKAKLAWYAQVWFWLPALLIIGLVAAKDALGTVVPPGLKKPLDVLELFENKVSGLVAAGALLPIIYSIFSHFQSSSGTASLAGSGFAAMDASGILSVLSLPFALAAYAAVWLVFHVVHVLVLLSPWGGIDAALKSARVAMMGGITFITYHHPWVGACLSLLVIVIAYFLAGWSFRMLVFGTVFGWDFLTRRKKRFTPSAEGNVAFAASKLDKVPVRTYGKLRKTPEGKFAFTYRTWLVNAPKTIELPAGDFAIGNGLLYPTLERVEGEDSKALLNFPPRCASHEAELGRIYGLPVNDVGLVKGFKAAWRWMKEVFGFGSKAAVQSVAA